MALKDLIGGSIGTLAEKIGGVVDRFVHTKDEKAAVMLELEKLAMSATSELEQSMRAELGAKERIMVAELTQGDNYTKRARPTLAYFGMAVILLNYVLAPIVAQFMGIRMDELELPAEFWYAWGGVVATWSVGRTMERRGVANNLVTIATGNGKSRLLD